MNQDSFLISNCRLCLSEKYKCVNIFENSRVVSKIIECTNLQISACDNYPKNICPPCLRQLNNAYKFKKQCENSAEILKNRILSNVKPSPVANSVSTNAQVNRDETFCNNKQSKEILAKIPNNASPSNKQTKLSVLCDKEQNNIEICTDSRTNCGFSECENSTSDFENSTNSLSHANDPDKSESLCGEVFTKNSLKVRKKPRRIEKLYQCAICSKSFTQLSNLYVHKHVHSDIRNFKCQICSMSFKLSSHLSVHMKIHSDIKDYKCSLCGKGFRKSSNLLIHMRTHSGEKPFSCEYCGKSFSDSSNLATHIRTHTGTKRFTCDVCDESFVQKVSMIRHQKRKHDKFS